MFYCVGAIVKSYWVYILASKKDGALYVGITSDLLGRVSQHRRGGFSGHTKKYNIRRLVWFEEFAEVDDALNLEKRLKRWRRVWKDDLIGKLNPGWVDLYEDLLTGGAAVPPILLPAHFVSSRTPQSGDPGPC